MGKETGIAWCDHTFNAVWGCVEISPGCANCYAREWAKRFGWHWGNDAARRTFGAKHWDELRLWNQRARADGVRRRVFCGSMFDIWEAHPVVRQECERLWPLIDKCDWLDFLLLSKRPGNALEFAPPAWRGGWPDNVWAMTTVENQRFAERRLGLLCQIPAKVRGVSAEPLLEAVDLSRWLMPTCPRCKVGGLHAMPGGMLGYLCDQCGERVAADAVARPIHWVIVGGESEVPERARAFCASWAERLRVQCSHYDVHFFMKQLGSKFVYDIDPDYMRCGHCGALINAHVHPPRDGLVVDCPNPACRMTIPARWNLAHPKGEDLREFPASLQRRESPASPARAATTPALFS